MSCNSCPPFGGYKFPSCFERYGGINNTKNPGNVKSLHSLAHNVMPKFYEGIELDYNHRLAPNKFILATWVLSHVKPAGFRFGGLYTFRVADDFMLTPTIFGDVHPTTLAANLNIIYYPFKPLRLEAALQKHAEEMPVQTEYTIEWTRPNDTWTANFYNVRNDRGRCTLSGMRSITQHWAIGGELLLEWNEPKRLMTDLAFAARYSHHNYSFAASASRQGLDVSYWQRIHPQIQMANMLAWNRNTRQTIATICYQWNFWNCSVHGMIDSGALVGFMWTRYLSYIPLQMGFSVVMSLPTDRFAFGMRFILDPSGLRRGE
ncbi:mitochondrial import receptor subunit TOM40 homolog 2 [Drosophila innubila]|uniref:mitochondrial import receptor subunit TOM40 homolog 2 n=1 Tax=Drosophila innubila TaxID=198719 RepID=UPI00148E1EB0|nr:mitochondrial import receptor subunit TOM40 homolog 2 [Drosophila innubila]